MSADLYPDSYYAATAQAGSAHAPLAGTETADVCVIGGGLAGCSTALELATRGYGVVLLEQHRIGWGASGRSGAQALFGVAAGEEKIEALLGERDARRVWDVTVAGLDLIRARITTYGIDCGWQSGQLHVAIKPRQDEELRRWADLLASKYDYRSLRYIAADELPQHVASHRYRSGMFDSRCGHLHPLNYTLGLASAAARAGARIFEHSRALRFENCGNSSVTVHTADGAVRCSYLVLCGNAYLGDLAPALARKIMAVGTYVIATEPLGAERARSLLPSNAAVTDVNWVLDYFRRSRDDRLLFGGRVSYSGLDPLNTASATRRRMLAVFPQLADTRIAYSWGGYVDITLNRAPHFGRLAPNVYFLQGFSGHGMALTGIAGQLVAEAIAGTAERFDVFARIAHRDFPGGAALRRPALVLAMLWYRLRDLL